MNDNAFIGTLPLCRLLKQATRQAYTQSAVIALLDHSLLIALHARALRCWRVKTALVGMLRTCTGEPGQMKVKIGAIGIVTHHRNRQVVQLAQVLELDGRLLA